VARSGLDRGGLAWETSEKVKKGRKASSAKEKEEWGRWEYGKHGG